MFDGIGPSSKFPLTRYHAQQKYINNKLLQVMKDKGINEIRLCRLKLIAT